MKSSTKVIIGIAAVIVVLAVVVFGGYNGLVSSRENVDTHASEIDNTLQRRSDLIPNLVAAVKEYESHENEIFTNVSEARAKLAGATTYAEKAAADTELNTALSRLLAIAEAYPDLKANQSFINLQDELAGTENRIANARRDYNEAAREYNTLIRKFPTNITAGIFGFHSKDYFEASEGSKENPDVGNLFGD